MASEAKSSWDCVYQKIDDQEPLNLGETLSNWHDHCPGQILNLMCFYKFAAKMIGKAKRVVDVGAGTGFGSWLLAKECGYCLGITDDELASKNFVSKEIDFASKMDDQLWDGIISFDIPYDQAWAKRLKPDGVVVVASEVLPDQSQFKQIFSFTMHGELIRCGMQETGRQIVVACGVKC